jgi:hypothetical protein
MSRGKNQKEVEADEAVVRSFSINQQNKMSWKCLRSGLAYPCVGSILGPRERREGCVWCDGTGSRMGKKRETTRLSVPAQRFLMLSGFASGFCQASQG